MYFTVFLISCAEPEPVRIGFVGSLSGKQSDIGVFARNAVQLYIDEINRNDGIHGKKIKLIIKDDKGSAETCEKILNKLIDDDIKFIIGPLFSQMAEAAMNSSKGKNVFVMSPSMSTPLLSGIDDNIFRTAYPTDVQSRIFADHFTEKGYKKVGVIYDLNNIKYTEPLYNGFRKYLADKGNSVKFTDKINSSETIDFSKIVLKIQNAGLDSLLLCLSAKDAATFAQMLKNNGSEIKLYGVSWTQTNDLIQYGGKAVEGMHLVSIFKGSKKTRAHSEFNEKYKQRYASSPSFICALAYDAANILIKGMKDADELAPSAVKSSILKQKKFYGLDTIYEFDAFGDVSGRYSLVVVKNGAFHPYKSP